MQRENKILLATQVSPPTCFTGWSGEQSPLCFTAAGIGPTPKYVVLHFPPPFSSFMSWVINYQQKCEPCQCLLRLPAKSPYSTEPRSVSAVSSLSLPSSSPLHLLSARAPPTALRSFFIYECILLNCVCKRTSQPLPCQRIGTVLLKRLCFSGSPGVENQTLAEIMHVFLLQVTEDQFCCQQRTLTLVMELRRLYYPDTTPAHWGALKITGIRQPEMYWSVYFMCSQNVKPGQWVKKRAIQSLNTSQYIKHFALHFISKGQVLITCQWE